MYSALSYYLNNEYIRNINKAQDCERNRKFSRALTFYCKALYISHHVNSEFDTNMKNIDEQMLNEIKNGVYNKINNIKDSSLSSFEQETLNRGVRCVMDHIEESFDSMEDTM